MTPPNQLIVSHFPHDSKWQLLDKPKTKSEFEKALSPARDFFKYNLGLTEYINTEITVSKELNYNLLSPENVVLMTRLYKDNKQIDNMVFFKKGR